VNSSSYIFIPIYQNLYFSCFLLINHQSSIINHQSSIINHQSSIINRNSVVEVFKFIDSISVLLNFSCCFSYGSLFDHTKEMGQTGKYQVCTNAGNHRRIHISEVQRIIDGKKRRYINKTEEWFYTLAMLVYPPMSKSRRETLIDKSADCVTMSTKI
jgi:hypothetical protein